MATDLTEEFFKGFFTGFPAFEGGSSPFIPTSPSAIAFEAGCYASNCWFSEQIKSVKMSRGLAVRVLFFDGPDEILRVSFDERTVTR